MVTITPMSLVIDLTENVIFLCIAAGYGLTGFMWTIGSGSFPNKVTGTNNNTLVIPDVRSSDDNTYTCVVSNEGGNGSNTSRLTVTGMN